MQGKSQEWHGNQQEKAKGKMGKKRRWLGVEALLWSGIYRSRWIPLSFRHVMFPKPKRLFHSFYFIFWVTNIHAGLKNKKDLEADQEKRWHNQRPAFIKSGSDWIGNPDHYKSDVKDNKVTWEWRPRHL